MKLFAPALLLAVLVAAPLSAREEPAPALSVEIAAPARFGKRTLELSSVPVVVANRSPADVRVWREWCSWGWFQLSFEIRDGTGNIVTVRKKERAWDKNYPDFWTLAPGEPLVLTANLLDAEAWGWSAPAADLRGKALEVRAVFAAEEDEASREDEVFHGEVRSPWRSYELR